MAERPASSPNPLTRLSRRGLLRLGAVGGAGLALPAGLAATDLDGLLEASGAGGDLGDLAEVEERTIAELRAMLDGGELTAEQLVKAYLVRIQALDRGEHGLNAVTEVNRYARYIGRYRDEQQAAGETLGPLHGIPILLKDTIDTRDTMQTTGGSLALVGDPASQDATVAQRLRQAGAVILGKANLSEWANFRGFDSTSGWSARGGQTRNPYVLDRNPCGSSSGSAAAVSANLAAAAIGTETDGSIVCPASACGVVGLKPTVGLVSRAGVIPISNSLDSIGPLARTVADAAAVLGALVGVDPRDPATAASAGQFFTDYTQFLDPNGLAGARIGVARSGGFTGYSDHTDAIFEQALAAMQDAGAILVDPADIPTVDELNADPAEVIVLIHEFKRDLNAYLATRTGVPVASLADVIDFNLAHADRELQFFGQEWFELSEAEIFTQDEYEAALAGGRQLAGPLGIDAILQQQNLDALVAPTGSPAWPTDLVNGDHFLGASSSIAALAGYPLLSVPAGDAFGLPVGITFMGTAWSEPTLIRLASGFEATRAARRAPTFLPTLQLPGPAEAERAAARRAAHLAACFGVLRDRLWSGGPSWRRGRLL